jgi:cysteine desulfurase
MIFTSGATESINLALRGPLPYLKDRNKVILTQADHRSVRSTAEALSASGFETDIIEIDEMGKIDIDDAGSRIDENTALVTLPFASNEVGTIQPVKEILELAHSAGSLVHVDLTMSGFQSPFNVKDVGVDLATLSSPDLMGPRGTGALFIRKGVKMTPIIRGGGQEMNLRSGSENIPGMVGMGAAARIAKERMEEDSSHLQGLRDRLIGGLLSIKDSHLNGDPVSRLPNNANIRFDYIEGESMLLMMDMNGISVATGSACAQKTLEASKTLLAMGLKHEQAHGSLVFTLGPYNKESDVDHVIEVMPEIVKELRAMSPIYPGEV